MSALTSEVKFDFEKIAVNEAKELHMMVSLEAPSMEIDSERAPLNISAVIDESGSMAGQKMEYVKASMHKMLDHLTPRDRIGLVGFTTDVREIAAPALMTPENKQKMHQAVDALRDRSTTNLSGGILRGFEQMRGASEDALNRVIVFTDGLANVGVTDIEALTSLLSAGIKNHSVKNITISCFGYGEDVDGDFLEAISKVGRGNYYHIDKPDNAPRAFGKELGGLLSTFAQNIRIKLTPKADVELVEVLNDFTVKPDGDSTVIEIDDVLAEEKRHVVVQLKVPGISEALAARPFKVCDVEIVYTSIPEGKQITDELKAKVQAAKNGNVQDKPDPDVEEQIAILKMANAVQQATNLADAGDYAGAKAAIGQARIALCTTQAYVDGSELSLGVAEEASALCTSVADAGAYAFSAQDVKARRGSYATGRSTSGKRSIFDTGMRKKMAHDFGVVEPSSTAAGPNDVSQTNTEPTFKPIIVSDEDIDDDGISTSSQSTSKPKKSLYKTRKKQTL